MITLTEGRNVYVGIYITFPAGVAGTHCNKGKEGCRVLSQLQMSQCISLCRTGLGRATDLKTASALELI